jgi:hypothetical protein
MKGNYHVRSKEDGGLHEVSAGPPRHCYCERSTVCSLNTATARELSERVSLLAQLDGLENRENPIPMAYLRARVRLLQAYEKLNDNWRVRDLKNRALSERIALLKELNAVGDLEMTEQQIKDRIRAIHDIRFRQQQKAEQAKRHVHVASILADLEESESDREESEADLKESEAA